MVCGSVRVCLQRASQHGLGAWLPIETPVTGLIPTLRLGFSVQDVYFGVAWIGTCGRRGAGLLSGDVGLIAALGSPTGPLELKWPIRVISL